MWAVTAAVKLIGSNQSAAEVTGCQHLDHIVSDIQQSTDANAFRTMELRPDSEKEAFVDTVARLNVSRVVNGLRAQSRTLEGLVREEQIAIVGAMYDVVTGEIEFLT